MQAITLSRRPLVVNALGSHSKKPVSPVRASRRASMLGLAVAWETLVRPARVFAAQQSQDPQSPQASADSDTVLPIADLPDDQPGILDPPIDDPSNSSPDDTVLDAVDSANSRSGHGHTTGGRH